MYNVLFTSWPPIVYGLLDQEYPRELLQSRCDLYSIGLQNRCFDAVVFWYTILQALFDGGLIFFFVFWGMDNFNSFQNGATGTFWMAG
jgi:phospholipid-translocating ATPase